MSENQYFKHVIENKKEIIKKECALNSNIEDKSINEIMILINQMKLKQTL